MKRHSQLSLIAVLACLMLLMCCSTASATINRLKVTADGIQQHTTTAVKVSKSVEGENIPENLQPFEIMLQGGGENQHSCSLSGGQSHTFSSLAAGTYTVSENNPQGAAVACNPATVTVQELPRIIYATVKNIGVSNITGGTFYWELLYNGNTIAKQDISLPFKKGRTFTAQYDLADNNYAPGKYQFHFYHKYKLIGIPMRVDEAWSKKFDYSNRVWQANVTVTNTYSGDPDEEETGTLTIKKVIAGNDPPENGNDAIFTAIVMPYSEEFMPRALSVEGDLEEDLWPQYLDFSVNNPGSIDLPPGTYFIAEIDGESRYPDSITSRCGDNTSDYEIIVEVGVNGAEVTFTNTYNREADKDEGFIQVNKIVYGDGPSSGYEVTIRPYFDEGPMLMMLSSDVVKDIVKGSNDPWIFGQGQYTIEESATQGAKSVSYQYDGVPLEEGEPFWVEAGNTSIITITNTFDSAPPPPPGGGDDDDYGFLKITKDVVGEGPDSGFRVKIYNDSGEMVKNITLLKGMNSIIVLDPGTYTIEETDSLDAINVTYSEQQFEIENNKTVEITITNSYEEEQEEVIIEEPPVQQPLEDLEEMVVNEPQPELPKTGADIFGMGLGLLLAGGGLLIRKYQK